jgi:parvulin-like peptidyl-prolyl isomerase
MNLLRITLALVALTATLAVSACGGGDGVPADAVAVVDGVEISRQELDELMARAKKAYEAQNQEFPNVGTADYKNVESQYLAFLVQREEFEKEADELGVEISEQDIDKAVAEFVKSRFDGDRKEFGKALAEQGFSNADFRETIATSVLASKIFDAVTKDVAVTDAEIAGYYTQNQANYGTPESRDVRHILVSEKGSDGQVDFAKSKSEADRLYRELRGGADFAALARASSDDPGSKANGGKLTITRGQTVPEFDKASFDLKVGVVSEPVKTTYGYHLIEALSPVRKAKTTPLPEVRDSIKSTLLQEKKTEVMTKWSEDLREEYEDKVSYASGFEPPEIPDATDTDTEPQPETE